MNRLLKTVRRGAIGLAAALLLSSCGGGDAVVPFEPTRLLAFGDETSAMDTTGRKFTVNYVTDAAPTTLVCASYPLWVQRLATRYDLVLNECNAGGVTTAPSRLYAQDGAKVADLVAQVDAHVAGGTGFSGDDLVTMMIGQNDLLEIYAAVKAGTTARADGLTELRARGATYAAQVSRVAALGGKVVASTPVDLRYSPYVLAEDQLVAGRRQLIIDLSDKFVEGFRAGLANESGTRVAMMLGNELTRLMGRSVGDGFGSTYSLKDSTTAVCLDTVVAVDQCTRATLISAAQGDATDYLWADPLHLSPAGHEYLGTLAINRSTANPF